MGSRRDKQRNRHRWRAPSGSRATEESSKRDRDGFRRRSSGREREEDGTSPGRSAHHVRENDRHDSREKSSSPAMPVLSADGSQQVGDDGQKQPPTAQEDVNLPSDGDISNGGGDGDKKTDDSETQFSPTNVRISALEQSFASLFQRLEAFQELMLPQFGQSSPRKRRGARPEAAVPEKRREEDRASASSAPRLTTGRKKIAEWVWKPFDPTNKDTMHSWVADDVVFSEVEKYFKHDQQRRGTDLEAWQQKFSMPDNAPSTMVAPGFNDNIARAVVDNDKKQDESAGWHAQPGRPGESSAQRRGARRGGGRAAGGGFSYSNRNSRYMPRANYGQYSYRGSQPRQFYNRNQSFQSKSGDGKQKQSIVTDTASEGETRRRLTEFQHVPNTSQLLHGGRLAHFMQEWRQLTSDPWVLQCVRGTVDADSRRFLTFQWQGQFYQFQCLPFGVATALSVSTKVLKVPVAILRRRGFRLVVYLDDILVIGRSREACREALWAATELLSRLGFVPNLEKSVLEPSQRITFLGSGIDTTQMVTFLPESKVLELQPLAHDVLTADRGMSARELASVIGRLQATTTSVWLAPLHFRSLQRLLIAVLRVTRGHWEQLVPLTEAASADLRWWTDHLPRHSRPILSPVADIVVETDASTAGWGEYSNGVHTVGRWSVKEGQAHINILELRAASLTVRAFYKEPVSKHVKVLTDNATVVAYLNRLGGTRSQRLLDIALDLWEWCVNRELYITAEHAPGKENIRADYKSRHILSGHGMDPGSAHVSGFASDISTTQEGGGSVRVPNKLPATSVCVVASRARGNRDRCVHNELEQVGSAIRFSPVHASCTNSKESTRRQNSPDSRSSGLGHSSLVPSPAGDAGRRTSATTSPQQSPVTARDRDASPRRHKNATSRLACLRSQHDMYGISPEVSKILLASWRAGTQKLYASAWDKWSCWCDRRHIHPVSAPLNKVLEFLLSLYDRGFQYRAINVYRSAISTTHLPLEGQPLGSHPLMAKTVLQEAGIDTSRFTGRSTMGRLFLLRHDETPSPTGAVLHEFRHNPSREGFGQSLHGGGQAQSPEVICLPDNEGCGDNYTCPSQDFPGNFDTDTEVINDFSDYSGPITARFIKIHPQTWHEGVSMRAKIIVTEPQPPSWSASSERSSRHSADRADINSLETANFNGGWAAARPGNEVPWLMRDLGDVSVITGIITKGRNSHRYNQWVTSYVVSYGVTNGDEKFYTDAEGQVTDFPGNFDTDTEVINDFSDYSGPITARFIKIHPQTWHEGVTMRAKIIVTECNKLPGQLVQAQTVEAFKAGLLAAQA
ncbi:hypothetical protein Bbelb_216560 [Branchiostoma belcheri]|nr:hypothetical protein Bbelb_216560 [Branchiostoma belcheri]